MCVFKLDMYHMNNVCVAHFCCFNCSQEHSGVFCARNVHNKEIKKRKMFSKTGKSLFGLIALLGQGRGGNTTYSNEQALPIKEGRRGGVYR